MADLLGINAILVASLIVFALAKRAPQISQLLFIALVLRLAMSLFNVYFGSLPDSKFDAVAFELQAWTWAQDEFDEVFFRYPSGVEHGWIVSWIISVLYNLTDRSILMAQTVSLIFGMGSIYLGWKLCVELWSEKVAIKSAWLIALFPSLSLYSVLLMREVYIYFFILLALLGVIRWVKFNKLKDLLIVIVGFVIAALFHGAMILGLLVFIGFAFYRSFNGLVTLSKNYFFYHLIIFTFSFIFLILFFLSKYSIPYIGSFEDIGPEFFKQRFVWTSVGGSAFPQWLLPSGFFETIWKTPIRILYFIISPMPWDISSPRHILGFIDGIFYIILLSYLWKGRKLLLRRQSTKILLTIFVVYLITFSLGTANSGTALRHKTKLFPILVVLAAPFIPVVNLRNSRVISRKKYESL